ncbi:hypothetical protein V2J09_002675 [Rumex salicifolius]
MDFSVFSISFFSFNLGRTHMFILCNGIVAILVKGSVLSDPHKDGEPELKEMKNVEAIHEISAEKPVVIIEQEEEIVSGCVLVSETEQVDQQFVEDELQEDQQSVEDELQQQQEEEEEEAEELSVEELNKKCDEFIRRMRGVISNGDDSRNGRETKSSNSLMQHFYKSGFFP